MFKDLGGSIIGQLEYMYSLLFVLTFFFSVCFCSLFVNLLLPYIKSCKILCLVISKKLNYKTEFSKSDMETIGLSMQGLNY